METRNRCKLKVRKLKVAYQYRSLDILKSSGSRAKLPHLGWNTVKKQPLGLYLFKKETSAQVFPGHTAKFWRLPSLENIYEWLLSDCFNDALIHRPKVLRSVLHDSVRLPGLSHRSSFLLLLFFSFCSSPEPEFRPALENLRRIPLMSQLTQPAFTSSKLTIETLGQVVKYVQN